jgi:hypothetical protein
MNAHASSEYSVDRLERQPRVRVAQFRSSVEMTEYLPTDPPILVGEPEQSQITRFETWKCVSHPNGILRTARYSHFSGGNLPRTSEARGHWKPVEVNKFQTTDPPIFVSEPEPSQITRFETWKRVSHPNGILRTARYKSLFWWQFTSHVCGTSSLEANLERDCVLPSLATFHSCFSTGPAQ